MKRWLIVGVLAVVVLAALGTAGYFIARSIHHQNILRKGLALYEEEEWKDARFELVRYLANYPEDVEILRKYADASLHIVDNRRDAINKAVNAYKQIHQADPSDEEAQRRLIELYEKLEEWAAVEFYADLFLSEGSADERWLRNRKAVALEQQGSDAAAIQAYRELIAQDEAAPEAYTRLAGLLQETTPEEAEEVMEAGLRRYGDDPAFLARAALVRASMEDERATELLQRARDAGPDHPEVLKARMRLAMRDQDWWQAAEIAERYLASGPEEAEAYYGLSAAYNGMGDNDKAIQALERAGPIVLADNPRLILTLADAQIGTGRLDEARETLAFYRKTRPSHELAFRYLQGRLLLAEGDTGQAIQEFLSVAEANPDFALARIYLAEAYRAAGQTRLARDTLKAYLRINPEDPAALTLAEALGLRQAAPPRELADRLLQDDAAPTSQLRTVAARLLRSAIESGIESEDARRVVQLFERAVERAPQDPRGYADYARGLIAMGELARARDVLTEGAAQAGETALALVQAELDLVDNRAGQAFERFTGVRKEGWDTETYLQWAQTFRRQGEYEEAERIVAEALTVTGDGEAGLPIMAERVTVLARQGKLDEARETLEQMTPQDPEPDAGALIRDARVALVQGLIAENSEASLGLAQTQLDAVLSEYPDDPAALTLGGELALAKDPLAHARAYTWFRRALESDPGHTAALLQLGGLALAEGNPAQALEYGSAVLAGNPGLLQGQLLTAEAETELGMRERALARLNAITGVQPNNARALELLAETHLALGSLQEAADAIGRLSEAAPGDASQVLRLQGLLAAAEGETGEAEDALRARLENDPSDLQTAEALAELLQNEGRSDEGREILETLASGESGSPRAWLALGDYHLASRTREAQAAAVKAFSRALMQDPDYAPALRRLVNTHMVRESLAEALAFAERYLSVREEDAAMWHLKAVILLDLGREPEEALEAVERARELSDRPQYRLTRALALIELGEEAEAAQDIRLAEAAMGPASPQVDLALGEALLNAGRIEEAGEYAQRARRKAENGELVNMERLANLEERIAQEG